MSTPAFRSFLTAALLAIPALAQNAQDPPKAPPAEAKASKAAATLDDVTSTTLKLGARVPDALALKDLDGKPHKAADFKGKIVVVNFYSITCPVMAAWDDRLTALQNDFAPKGVTFLNIDSNRTEIGVEPPAATVGGKPYADIRQHLADGKRPYTLLVDHGNVVADVFGAKTTPDVFVFGVDGKLVYRGLIDDDQSDKKGEQRVAYVRDLLVKLVAGEKVEPSETKPAGCSIKRVDKKAAAPKPATKDAAKEAGK